MQNSNTIKLADTPPTPNKSGYLFERKNGRVYQSWSRKYYNIFDGELICTTRNPKVRLADVTTSISLSHSVLFRLLQKMRMDPIPIICEYAV